jgi:hypothetical protein
MGPDNPYTTLKTAGSERNLQASPTEHSKLNQLPGPLRYEDAPKATADEAK